MDWSQLGQYSLDVIVLAVMLVGLVGLIIPILPGLVIIWLAGLVYGIATGFTLGSSILFAFFTVLMLVGSVIDNVIMGASARQKGASWVAIAISMVLGVVGSLVFPPFGGLVAALLGLFAYEFWRLKDWRQALDSTKSMAIGCGWTTIIRAAMGAVMIGLWVIWATWL
jgi:uncharacterized protein